MQFDTIELAIEALRNGESIIVVDDEDTINFMAREGRGLICAPIDKSIAERLKLQSMEQNNTDIYGTHFTVSIDHYKTTTGISAHERTQTARALIDENTNPEDFHRPGHLFPLIAKENGVLTRNGHTEAAVDLARLTGAQPAGVICEIMNDDGTMAKGEDLQSFKERHHLKMITIKSLVAFRKAVELNVNLKAKVKMPTDFGHFDMYGFTTDYSDEEIVAIVKGDLKSNPNVRMHSACLTGDIFHSQRCDCGAQLEASMKYIDEHGGMIIYLPQEGRGIGLINKLRAYELIEKGYDTVTANLALGFDEDLRDYHVAAEILKYFDISEINLLSNNPKKFEGLEDYGIEIVDRIELIVPETQYNHSYMETKKNKMGHLI